MPRELSAPLIISVFLSLKYFFFRQIPQNTPQRPTQDWSLPYLVRALYACPAIITRLRGLSRLFPKETNSPLSQCIKIVFMKQNTKDWIQYGSAIALIISGIAIALLSVIVTMDIGGGALAYIGEAFGGALAIFGIAAYALRSISDFKKEITEELRLSRKSDDHGTDY